MTATACPQCSAPIPHPRPNFCAYCGTSLPPPDSRAAATAEPRDPRELLAQMRLDPRFAQCMEFTPTVPGVTVGLISTVVFLVFFVGVCLFLSASITMVMGPAGVVPLFMAGVGVLAVIGIARKSSRFTKAPLVREPVVVVDERTELSGGGESSVRTSYYVTIELEDGRRREVETEGEVAGAVVPGDVGVAYLKSRYLIDFERLGTVSAGLA